MKKLTKKYIFERKLDGKPIIIQVKKGYGRWATKEDLVILRECGILIEHRLGRTFDTIITHEILTYLIPVNLDHKPMTRIAKGHVLPAFLDINVTD